MPGPLSGSSRRSTDATRTFRRRSIGATRASFMTHIAHGAVACSTRVYSSRRGHHYRAPADCMTLVSFVVIYHASIWMAWITWNGDFTLALKRVVSSVPSFVCWIYQFACVCGVRSFAQEITWLVLCQVDIVWDRGRLLEDEYKDNTNNNDNYNKCQQQQMDNSKP